MNEQIRQVLSDHFVMWHALDLPSRPPGEWRCACGEKFGFSDTAIDHVTAKVEAVVTQEMEDLAKRVGSRGAQDRLPVRLRTPGCPAGVGMSPERLEFLARMLCKADDKVWWTEYIPAVYFDKAKALAPAVEKIVARETGSLRERVEEALPSCGHQEDEREKASALCTTCAVLVVLQQK